ncbi:IS1380 family transposase [Chondromyces crocatus]|uniref:Transposase DDE domain-containing protein n=1 Tax=Chondromyces crocatus TaxID=52 RepID=A0A0K1EAX9_CHOCO|nr:IS1380 family transposase [Chondromyces crocatus]AKT37837.1 uncharacterized protein CMC5_019800 [Chondromyces crocatus]
MLSPLADPLFVHLCGGVLPCLETVYTDLRRFDDTCNARLEAMVAQHGLAELTRPRVVHLDIDTTVMPLFGDHEGALLGPNPHYRGRPSYHPILARIAETDTCVGAQLRPGNTGFGSAEAPLIAAWIDRTRAHVGPDCLMYVRIDSAGDCTEVMDTIAQHGAFFLTKARMGPALCGVVAVAEGWETFDWDADKRPLRQTAVIDFARDDWRERQLAVRVVAIRVHERECGKQLFLWDDNEFTVQVFLTNDMVSSPEDLAQKYNDRAGIEPLIAEFKSAWGIGKAPSERFEANQASLLLKLLAHSLLRRNVTKQFAHLPELRSWRAPWLQRILLRIPGRLIRSGRSVIVRLPPRPAFMPLLN